MIKTVNRQNARELIEFYSSGSVDPAEQDNSLMRKLDANYELGTKRMNYVDDKYYSLDTQDEGETESRALLLKKNFY